MKEHLKHFIFILKQVAFYPLLIATIILILIQNRIWRIDDGK